MVILHPKTRKPRNIAYKVRQCVAILFAIYDVITETGSCQRKTLEVDLVCNRGYERVYIQSAYAMDTDEKRDQELASLHKLRDGFRRIVIVNGLHLPT